MSWQRGQRRHTIDAARFVRALCSEFSCRELARLCGVSDRTVRRWRDGEDWPDAASLHRLIDTLFPCPSRWRGHAQLSSAVDPDDSGHAMGIDPSRALGVGEWSLRTARGDHEYVHSAVEEYQS